MMISIRFWLINNLVVGSFQNEFLARWAETVLYLQRLIFKAASLIIPSILMHLARHYFLQSLLLVSIFGTLALLAARAETDGPLHCQLVGYGTDGDSGLSDGRVIKVTNLNASGSGSLQAALSASDPRIIVFEVGGIIDLDQGSF